ncbi:IclR family transcriptional regulator [Nocardia altamirensis]|uniref:IclR family transcriptional regulator n=1 Tax=Nocardia altamirensis TaxID=472158 RepID=UPI000840950F|nr:IclR family transcriptional regulator [Nocardia altamirensis]
MGTSSDVPALRRGLAVLQLLAGRAGPISASTIARELDLPRSTTYHLLGELEAARFVTRLPSERRYGLGIAAFELGSAYLRHDPLERLAGPLLRELVEEVGHNAHLGVLHGNELLYLIKERPVRPETLVTGVGVRLPAHLTACGRAILAHLPAAQIRALFPSASSFVRRTERGPNSLAALRSVLATELRRGWACEDGHVTPGYASVGYPVFDHNQRPIAAISVTLRHHCETIPCPADWAPLAVRVRATADSLTHRIGGRTG